MLGKSARRRERRPRPSPSSTRRSEGRRRARGAGRCCAARTRSATGAIRASGPVIRARLGAVTGVSARCRSWCWTRCGVGGANDAAAFGDEGADTLGHLAAACASGAGDVRGITLRPAASSPTSSALGSAPPRMLATGAYPAGLDRRDGCRGQPSVACDEDERGQGHAVGPLGDGGAARSRSTWGLFPPGPPSFPPELLDELVERAGLPGRARRPRRLGYVILDELGAEHVATGKPIVYTSADSVFQIAAHEEHFGLERLYERLRDRARARGRVPGRPRDRASIRRRDRRVRTDARSTAATTRRRRTRPTLLEHVSGERRARARRRQDLRHLRGARRQ